MTVPDSQDKATDESRLKAVETLTRIGDLARDGTVIWLGVVCYCTCLGSVYARHLFLKMTLKWHTTVRSFGTKFDDVNF
jgi:hypothetical protein